jgi:hypothetical protein
MKNPGAQLIKPAFLNSLAKIYFPETLLLGDFLE